MQRFWRALFVVIASFFAATLAFAQPTVYSNATSGPFFALTNFTAPCTIGPCQNFSAGMLGSASFTTASPLPSNLVNADIRALVTAYTLTSGIDTISSTNPNARFTISVSTDGTGAITFANVQAHVWITPSVAHVLGDRASYISFSGVMNGAHNRPCGALGGLPGNPPDSCIFFPGDSSSSSAAANIGAWSMAPLVPPSAIPSLSTWGLICLAGLLAMFSAIALRRKGQ